MFKACLENRITRRKNSYKCYLCHYESPENDLTLMLKHVESAKHIKFKVKALIDNQTLLKELEVLLTISETQRRKLVDNGITFCKTFDYFRCHFCKLSCQGLTNTFNHIRSPIHIEQINEKIDNKANNKTQMQNVARNNNEKQVTNENIKKFNNAKKEIVEKRRKTVDTDDALSCIEALILPWFKCTICKCEINGQINLKGHVLGRSHLIQVELQKAKDKKPTNKVQDKVVNSVVNKQNVMRSDDTSYITKIQFCTTCQVYLKNPKVTQFHDKLHLSNEFSISNDIDIINFKITRNRKAIIQCLLCNSYIANEEELEKHLETPNHVAHSTLFEKIGDIKLKEGESNVISIEREKLKKFEIDYSKCSSTAFMCTLCDAYFPNKSFDDHLNGKRHLTNVQNLDTKNSDSIGLLSKNAAITYDCFLCKKKFSDFIILFCHYSSNEHQLRLKSFKIVMKDPYTKFAEHRNMITCTLCNTFHYHSYSAVQHLTSRNHQTHLEQKKINSASNTVSTSNIVELKSKQMYEKTEKTNKKVTELQSNDKKSNTQLMSKQNIEESNNIKSDQKNNPAPQSNQSKKTKKKHEFKTSPEELIRLGFRVENLDLEASEDFDDILNDLVDFNLSPAQEKKLPMGLKGKKPRKPKTEIKKVNSFCKNVKLFGKNYIKLCISSGKENIYNIDPEDIRLIKLACDFIFPWESEKVCLPCAEQLPNDKLVIYEHLQNREHIETMQEMEANDKEFEDYPDQYSDLKLAHLHMGEESDDWIQCYACDLKIKNENLEIVSHSLDASHMTKSQHYKKLSGEMYQEFSTIFKDIWYYAQVFVCEICKKKYDFEIDFVIHLEGKDHKKKIAAENSKCNKFCFCPACITYWYGKSDSFKIHCKDLYHKLLVTNGDLKIPNMTNNALNFLSSISVKVKSMIEESNKAVFEKCKVSALIEAIEETVQCKYPKAKAYIFGSRLSQLAFPDSDVDIFLDCEGVYYESTSQEQCQKYLSSIRCYFENNPNVWIVEEIILITRVPIIKLKHIPSQLKCDISFMNGLSVEKSTLVGNYNHAYFICRELILYLKKWLNICQISGKDCITTFAISWCVIFYLQVQGILPSVYELIRKNNQTKIIDGWECGFLEQISVNSSVSNLNFSDHLYGFFSYYATFDYKTDVLCPYLGKVIQKSTFVYADNLPKEMKIYKDRLKAEKSDIFRIDSPMCIQDPIDLSQNLTKAVKKRKLRCFRQYCIESANEVSKEIET